MEEIDKFTVNNVEFKFYHGIDFELAMDHDKSGCDGFIYLFIENVDFELDNYNKKLKIDYLINTLLGSKCEPPVYVDNYCFMNNNYLCVYQTCGCDLKIFSETIKNKIIMDNYKNWEPVVNYRANI